MIFSKLKAFLFIMCFISLSFADDYHYKDVLVGERASGLGGSFIAISDDPSGLWYNPAGILFSFENYFSLSANAYNETSEVYKNVFKGENYTYKSKGLIPNFFGFTQTYKDYKWGFSIVVPKSDFLDQDDEVTDISSTAGEAKNLTRKFFRQNNVTGIGLGGASKIKDGFTIGLSLFVLQRDEKIIDNQLVEFNTDATNSERFYFLNRSYSKKTYSLYPKLGMQYMPTKEISIGATLAKMQHISGEKKNRNYENATNSTTGKPNNFQYKLDQDLKKENTTTKAFELSPLEVGLGIAYFPSKYLMISSDINYYSSDSDFKEFKTVDTLNISVGTEYFFSDKKAIRLGFYTNNANTSKLNSTATDQAPNVDMYGLTASMSLFSSGSALSFGTLYSKGAGKGQAIGGVTAQQDISRDSVTVYFTGSYQM